MSLTDTVIAGHAWQRAALQRELQRDRVAPCYLFAGPSGTGKRLVALEFLKAYLCLHPNPQAGHGCGTCAACRALALGKHPDLHLVAPPQAAGRIEITLVREQVIEVFDIVPKLSSRRGMVIDAAERLSEEAQNALLKTLEEPPVDACVILIASSEAGLLPTILSRVRFLRFGRLEADAALAALRSACVDLEPSEEDLHAALELADGSPGHALEVLAYELFSERETLAGWIRDGAPQPSELRDFLPGLNSQGKLEGNWAERSLRLRKLWQFSLLLVGRELRRGYAASEPAALLDPLESSRRWSECCLRALGELDAMVTPELSFELWAAALPRA